MMKNYRYPFEKKHTTCPSCGHHKKFSRHVDRKTGEYLPDEYGRCERLNSCGYSLNPYKNGYADAVREKEKGNEWSEQKISKPKFKKRIIQPKQFFIPKNDFNASLRSYNQNNFAKYLSRIFGTEIALKLIQRFFIGTSKRWSGANVFWYINQQQNISYGKILSYKIVKNECSIIGEDCKRSKNADGNGLIDSVASVIERGAKYRKEEIKSWVVEYQNQSKKINCFFGEHQLSTEPKNKPIAIAESEKTAIIASVYFPEFIWLATGGLSNLSPLHLSKLAGRKITLFPDNGALKAWIKKADEASDIISYQINDLMEREGNDGEDLADYLIQYDWREFVKKEAIEPEPTDLTEFVKSKIVNCKNIILKEKAYIKTNNTIYLLRKFKNKSAYQKLKLDGLEIVELLSIEAAKTYFASTIKS